MSTAQFTCILCNVTFQSSEVQRVHYRSEWHLYNLKRKIAGLPPVLAHVFSQKVIESRAMLKEESEKLLKKKKNSKYHVFNSNKNVLRSEGEYEQLDMKRTGADEESFEKSVDNIVDVLDHVNLHPTSLEETCLDEVDEEEMIKRRISKSVRLKISDCLFCPLKFSTLDENLKHMKKSHSLFLPNQEYIVDLEGLITYLGEKISIGNVCLSCEKVGKNLNSIRQHMFSKGHYSIAYSTEEQKLELSDYYDFGLYSTNNESDWEDVSFDQDSKDDVSSIDSFDDRNIMIDNDYELILPSKVRLGHRSLIRYYQQNLNSRNFKKHTQDRNKSGLVKQEYVQRSLQGVSDSRKEFSKKHIKTFQDIRQKENFRTIVALKSNHKKHFRNELLQ